MPQKQWPCHANFFGEVGEMLEVGSRPWWRLAVKESSRDERNCGVRSGRAPAVQASANTLSREDFLPGDQSRIAYSLILYSSAR